MGNSRGLLFNTFISTCALTSTLLLSGCFGSNITFTNSNVSPVLQGGQGTSGAARLTLDGKNMLTPDGKIFFPRGFNWGDWGRAQPQDAGDNVAQGANTVRILLRWWGQYSDPSIDARTTDPAQGYINPANLARVNLEVNWAMSKGLWVVFAIDSDCGQNGLQDSGTQGYCDPQNQYASTGHNFWSDPAMRAQFFTVWRYMANYFKNTPNIAMYELLPEPNPTGPSQADVTEFYKEAIRNLRTIDTQTPVLIGATKGYNISNTESAYIPDAEFANQIVYTGDLFVYTGQSQSANIANLSTRLQGLLDTRDHHNVPIFVQQTGVKTSDDPTYVYLNAVLSLLDSNTVGWTWWTYRDHTSSPDNFGCYYPDSQNGWIAKPETCSNIASHFTP